MTRKGYKTCLLCCEIIREQAKVCRFCGAVLTTEALPVRIPVSASRKSQTGSAEFLRATTMDDFSERGIRVPDGYWERINQVMRDAREEYRTATVLMADLSGFTALFGKLSPESVKGILDPFYNLSAEAVALNNGFLVKFIGDAVLAVFGAPVAFDHDAKSAVRAALEIQQKFKRIRLPKDVKLGVSMGIATGQIMMTFVRSAGQVRFDIIGDAVNLSQRVQSEAGSGVICVDEATAEATRSLFAYEAQEPQKLKNVDRLVQPFRLIGEKEIDQSTVTEPEFEFLGRAKELGDLQEILNCAAEGSRSAAVIVGEGGIGKTRLIREATRTHGQAFRWIFTECLANNLKLPLQPVRSLAGQILNVHASDTPAGAERIIKERISRDHLGKPGDAKYFLYLLGFEKGFEQLRHAPPSSIRKSMLALVKALIRSEAERQPLVWVIDDFHWADPSTAAFVDEWLTEGGAEPLAVMMALRPRSEVQIPGRKAKKIPLKELSREEASTLLTHLFDAGIVAPELSELILKKSQGNPLYLEELTKSLKRLFSPKELQQAKSILPRIAEYVPDSLKALIQSRIDLLEMRNKLVLQCGAVIGQRFSLSIIRLFEMIREGLLERLYVLREWEFLTDSPRKSDTEFIFRNLFGQEVAYFSLLDSERQALHRLIATQIEATLKNRLPELCADLAFHYDRGQVEEKSLYYLMMGAERAYRLSGYREALLFHDRALKKMESGFGDRTLRTKIHLRKARLHRLLGEIEDSFLNLNLASDSIGRNGSPNLKAELLQEKGLSLQHAGKYDEALRQFKQVIAIPLSLRGKLSQAMAFNGIALCHWGQGRWDQCLEHLRKGMRLKIEQVNPSIAGDLENNAGLVMWRKGRIQEALELFQKSMKRRHQSGDKFGAVATALNIGILEEHRGELKRATKAYEKTRELAQSIGFQQAMVCVEANIGNLLYNQGRYDEAWQRHHQSYDLARKIGDQRSEAIALENIGQCHLARGERFQAAKQFRQAMRLADGMNDEDRKLSLECDWVEYDLARGAIDSAVAHMSLAKKPENAAVSEDLVCRRMRLEAQCLIAQGQAKVARQILKRALGLAEKTQNLWEQFRMLKELCSLLEPDAPTEERRTLEKKFALLRRKFVA